MELRDLEYFAVVAEHGNLRRAAEALDLSQPALSKSLRRLEQIVGAKMVKRTPKRVGISYRKDAYLSPLARRFIEILKATAKKIATENT